MQMLSCGTTLSSQSSQLPSSSYDTQLTMPTVIYTAMMQHKMFGSFWLVCGGLLK